MRAIVEGSLSLLKQASSKEETQRMLEALSVATRSTPVFQTVFHGLGRGASQGVSEKGIQFLVVGDTNHYGPGVYAGGGDRETAFGTALGYSPNVLTLQDPMDLFQPANAAANIWKGPEVVRITPISGIEGEKTFVATPAYLDIPKIDAEITELFGQDVEFVANSGATAAWLTGEDYAGDWDVKIPHGNIPGTHQDMAAEAQKRLKEAGYVLRRSSSPPNVRGAYTYWKEVDGEPRFVQLVAASKTSVQAILEDADFLHNSVGRTNGGVWVEGRPNAMLAATNKVLQHTGSNTTPERAYKYLSRGYKTYTYDRKEAEAFGIPLIEPGVDPQPGVAALPAQGTAMEVDQLSPYLESEILGVNAVSLTGPETEEVLAEGRGRLWSRANYHGHTPLWEIHTPTPDAVQGYSTVRLAQALFGTSPYEAVHYKHVPWKAAMGEELAKRLVGMSQVDLFDLSFQAHARFTNNPVLAPLMGLKVSSLSREEARTLWARFNGNKRLLGARSSFQTNDWRSLLIKADIGRGRNASRYAKDNANWPVELALDVNRYGKDLTKYGRWRQKPFNRFRSLVTRLLTGGEAYQGVRQATWDANYVDMLRFKRRQLREKLAAEKQQAAGGLETFDAFWRNSRSEEASIARSAQKIGAHLGQQTLERNARVTEGSVVDVAQAAHVEAAAQVLERNGRGYEKSLLERVFRRAGLFRGKQPQVSGLQVPLDAAKKPQTLEEIAQEWGRQLNVRTQIFTAEESARYSRLGRMQAAFAPFKQNTPEARGLVFLDPVGLELTQRELNLTHLDWGPILLHEYGHAEQRTTVASRSRLRRLDVGPSLNSTARGRRRLNRLRIVAESRRRKVEKLRAESRRLSKKYGTYRLSGEAGSLREARRALVADLRGAQLGAVDGSLRRAVTKLAVSDGILKRYGYTPEEMAREQKRERIAQRLKGRIYAEELDAWERAEARVRQAGAGHLLETESWITAKQAGLGSYLDGADADSPAFQKGVQGEFLRLRRNNPLGAASHPYSEENYTTTFEDLLRLSGTTLPDEAANVYNSKEPQKQQVSQAQAESAELGAERLEANQKLEEQARVADAQAENARLGAERLEANQKLEEQARVADAQAAHTANSDAVLDRNARTTEKALVEDAQAAHASGPKAPTAEDILDLLPGSSHRDTAKEVLEEMRGSRGGAFSSYLVDDRPLLPSELSDKQLPHFLNKILTRVHANILPPEQGGRGSGAQLGTGVYDLELVTQEMLRRGLDPGETIQKRNEAAEEARLDEEIEAARQRRTEPTERLEANQKLDEQALVADAQAEHQKTSSEKKQGQGSSSRKRTEQKRANEELNKSSSNNSGPSSAAGREASEKVEAKAAQGAEKTAADVASDLVADAAPATSKNVGRAAAEVAPEIKPSGLLHAPINSKMALAFGLGALAVGVMTGQHKGTASRGKRRQVDPQTENVKSASLAAGITSLSTNLLTKNRGYAGAVRAGVFFGATAAMGVGGDTLRGQDLGTAVAANAMAGAAGVMAYAFGRANAGKGYQAFTGFLRQNSLGAAATKMEAQYAKALAKFPQLGLFMTPDTAAIGLAMGTIPVAHSLIQRSIAMYHRSQNTAAADLVNQSYQFENQAGKKDGWAPGSGEYAPGSAQLPTDVNFKTHVTEFLRRPYLYT